jgi:hypothetical protein
MARTTTLLLPAGAIGAAVLLAAAEAPSVLTQAQPGVWEISGAPGLKTPVRQCIGDLAALARFEHRANNCAAKIVSQSATSVSVDYSCGGAGFGHSDVNELTPRSLRISTQGISGGLPFNYVLQARRVEDCSKSATVTRH